MSRGSGSIVEPLFRGLLERPVGFRAFQAVIVPGEVECGLSVSAPHLRIATRGIRHVL